MASNIGRLTVDLRLNSQKFSAGLKKANASLTSLRSRANGAVKSMGGMQTRIAALVGVAGLGAMINQSLKAGDAIGKLSDRIGISTENLSAFQHLAELNGESIEGFDKSIERMVRSIGEANRGMGTGIKAFKDLGISVDTLKGKNADEQFLIISDAIKDVGDESLQASYASDIFGRSGIRLLNTIKSGRDGFEDAKDEVKDFGLAISRVDAAKIEAANDAILRSQKAVKGASMAATVELAPIIETVAERFVAAGTEGEGFAGKVKGAVSGASKFIGVFADGIHGIKIILKAAETAIKGFGFVWATVMDTVINQALVPFANSVTNFVLKPIREVLKFAAEYSDQAQAMLDSMSGLGDAPGFKSISNLANTMKESFENSRGELQEAMMKTIPSEQMKEAIDSIYKEAQEKAVETAKKVSKTYNEEVDKTDSTGEGKKEDEDTDDVGEKKNYLQKIFELELGNSKKIARAKQAIRLKETIALKWKALGEAVGSAPFPANLPAIAFATAESIAAIAGVRSAGSFEGGGFTGRGARVAGVDGRGGMPATVHPNEMVVDMAKGQGMGGVTINAPITIHGNSEQEVLRAIERQPKKIKRMLTQIQARPL